MKDDKKYLLQLLDKKELSFSEKSWLLNYIENTDQRVLMEVLENQFTNNLNDSQELNSEKSIKILSEIHQKICIPEAPSNVFQLWIKRVAVAACFIGVISIGVLYLTQKNTGNFAANHRKSKTFSNDINAGGQKATLTLANGTKILLDDAKNGTLSNQGNTKVIKTNGKLAYNANNSDLIPNVFNEVSTPRGGHYQVILPDGSQVWLNAASSIRFPTAFTGKERKVEITGEAYFEVAKNKTLPFIVKVNNSEVRVFGTHFNVMAYIDEAAVKTTLLEGSVQFSNGSSSCMLKPGEQSELNRSGQVKVVSGVDVDNVIAWKNNLFEFENVDIEVVMRQLSRWYDVDVVYNKKVNDHFFAEIPTTVKLSEVLRALELTGKVNFDIQGRKIIINP
ncbi:FecR domain-containing protein [Mucilaginibacter sp. BJC16-A38]|uniref:FecR family protein n=1 Tax=Mucilaginibacter phenanthrenivorans TaxID=1234842 RepID=UPI0021573A1B|nr:FecR family protein [Mucilaginibacter phenanthrenivorans]MCR8559393.1 FecR domain-containing protein [Mucilaginibacter phenanthrenivorans]